MTRKNALDNYVQEGYLLKICQDVLMEICEEAEQKHGLQKGDLMPITTGNTKRVKSIVFYHGEIVFEVSFLASENMGYFFYMTKEQARDRFINFFSLKRGDAA